MRKKLLTKKVTIKFRCTEYEANKMQSIADIYFNGNVSEWIRFATVHSPKKRKGPRPGPL